MEKYPKNSKQRKIKFIQNKQLVQEFIHSLSGSGEFTHDNFNYDDLNELTEEKIDSIIQSLHEDKEVHIFSNKRAQEVECEYWCMFDFLTLEQLTAITLGKNPEVVTLSEIKNFEKDNGETDFTRSYIKRFNLLKQLIGNNGHIELKKFITWAKKVNLNLPKKINERFLKHLKLRHEMSENTKLTLKQSPYWNEISMLCEKAIQEYPKWRSNVRKVQKTGNLTTWLKEKIGANTDRDAEFIKKVLSDFFEELH